MVQRKSFKKSPREAIAVEMFGSYTDRWGLGNRELGGQGRGAGKCWAQKENIKRLHLVASAVLQHDQVTEHPKFMMLSAKQEAISGAFRNNEILISLKTGE